MEFCDLKTQYQRLREPINAAIQRVLEHGRFIMGPEVLQLEQELAQFCEVQHCVSCASGTDALLMVLMACGIGPGDRVLTTPFTFIATAEPIALLGATPVFVDVDPRCMNLCPQALEETLHSERAQGAKAIIAVDLFGRPADYAALRSIADKHRLTLIADGAQSMGARFKGRSPMAWADWGTTSFFPAKPLGAYGDGGAIFCKDSAQAELLRSIRVHGRGSNKYENLRVGINGRLDTLQAAVLIEKLKSLPSELAHRQKAAELYTRLLAPLADWVQCPEDQIKEGRSAWAQYTVVCKDGSIRERLREILAQRKMPTAVYYPIPLHLSPAFAALGYACGDFKHSEWLAQRVMSLPLGPDCDLGAVEAGLRDLGQQIAA